MIALIAACDRNRVIGKAGRIPWDIPGERARFRELTSGNIVVMGRRTYEEIARPLPNRLLIVLSRDPAFRAHFPQLSDSGFDSVFDSGGPGSAAWASGRPISGLRESGAPDLAIPTQGTIRSARSLREALAAYPDRDLYIAGGAGLYREALPLAEKLYLTEIDAEYPGDTFFPEFDASEFLREAECEIPGNPPYRYVTYTRRAGAVSGDHPPDLQRQHKREILGGES